VEHAIGALVVSDNVASRIDVDSLRENRAGKIDGGENSPA
jgi:hypothetical protein